MGFTISPNKAVKRGTVLILIPIALMSPLMVLFWALSAMGKLHWVWAPLGTLLYFLIAWLFWSLTITHWKIWAYARVNNIDELKDQARERGLIYTDRSFFERTEIRTKKQRTTLARLENQLSVQSVNDELDNSNSIPPTFSLNYNHKKYKKGLIFSICLQVLLLAMEFMTGNKGSLIMVALLLFPTITAYRNYIRRLPTLTLSASGITYDQTYYDWKDITNESIGLVGRVLFEKPHLIFEHQRNQLAIDLSYYETGLEIYQLRNLLKAYRIKNTTVNRR